MSARALAVSSSWRSGAGCFGGAVAEVVVMANVWKADLEGERSATTFALSEAADDIGIPLHDLGAGVRRVCAESRSERTSQLVVDLVEVYVPSRGAALLTVTSTPADED